MKSQKNSRGYILAAEKIIRTRQRYQALGKSMSNLGLSRQKSIDWLDQKLFHELDRPVFHAHGEEFHIYPGIYEDAYFGSFDYRWNSDVKVFADLMPQRAPNKNLLLRLWLWDLAFKVDGNPIHLSS